MHRPSGVDLPDSPIGHHWMDVTHVSFGVATLGLVAGPVKLDASAFNGREPDEHRWGFESPRFSSLSARVTVNPSPALSIQASWARLDSPEILHPGSGRDADERLGELQPEGLEHDRDLGPQRAQRGPLDARPSPSTGHAAPRTRGSSSRRCASAAPTPSSAGRSRRTRTSSSPVNDPFHSRVFPVGKVEAGYVWDARPRSHLVPGLGLAAAVHFLPEFLEPDYGRRPLSLLVFARLKLR